MFAAVLLTGCAGAADPGAGGSTAVAATPSATRPPASETPAPAPAVTVDSLVVRSEGIDLGRTDGSSETYGYFDDTQTTIDALTVAFGSDPVVEDVVPERETGPGTTYTWPGVVITDPDTEGNAPFESEYWIAVTAASLNNVDLQTVDGIQVGDSAPALEAAYPDGATRISVGGGPERLDVNVDTVGLPARDSVEAGELTFSVWLIAPDPSGELNEFRAPSPNFEN
ncbi:hypothetical protein PA27867_1394 [Cryobacterium arcticum]|uniref:Uncharacterized protein n=2 Tax=Cryobacterium arcticum TaxID=670052 RepID=A0A1B1BIK4_9MICO|nr:hypothetical protein PA27867_1394 [Cryobacterium arcticum]